MLRTSTQLPPTRPMLSERASAGGSSAIRDLLEQTNRPGMISLAGGLPDASVFPTNELAAIADRVIREHGERALQYGMTSGDEAARARLATLFSPDTDPARVVITTGSQQALDLIGRVVVNPGDQVVVGDPDYLGALQVFRSYQARLHPIAVDAQGMDTAQLEDELQWGLRPKCLYLVPHFHNPTGASMSAPRRAHLNELSQRYGFLVIEDDPYRALYYDGISPGACAHDPELTVQLRSTSKTLAPGLRIGALAGPAWLTAPVVAAKQSVDLHTSSLSQTIAAEALGSPWIDDHLKMLRQVYAAKRYALLRALEATFGANVELTVPAGGMFLWARFPHVDDTAAWLTHCLDQGVCFVPGQAFAVQRNLSNYVRLSFATSSVEELDQAVTRMASALDCSTGGLPSAPHHQA